MGDANQYQRFFASKNARGAKLAAILMVFAVLLIECLIILEAWICSSMIPDFENGKYVLIYAAKNFMPLALGTLFLVTIVGIIIFNGGFFFTGSFHLRDPRYLFKFDQSKRQRKESFISQPVNGFALRHSRLFRFFSVRRIGDDL